MKRYFCIFLMNKIGVLNVLNVQRCKRIEQKYKFLNIIKDLPWDPFL